MTMLTPITITSSHDSERVRPGSPAPALVPLLPVERDTVNRIFLSAVDRFGEREVLRHKIAGAWQSLTYREVERRVLRLSAALDRCGLKFGDRVAILSESRPEWPIADYALLGLGAIDVPIYPTLPADQILVLLQDAEVRIVFVSTRDQGLKIAAIRDQVPSLERVIAFDDLDPAIGAESLSHFVDRMAEPDPAWSAAFRRRALSVDGGALATIIYTSGTTGTPKGVGLTHYNLAAMIAASRQHGTLPVRPGDVALSLLPLSHIFERAGDYYLWDSGVTIAYAESIANVPANLLEVRPNVMFAVPRLFEKIHGKVMDAAGLKGRLVHWAVPVGIKAVEAGAEGNRPGWRSGVRYRIADLLVFRKLRAKVGGRLRTIISGGAPLSEEVAKFFCASGLPIYEGYGLTETSPVLTANRPGGVRFGTVGTPYPGVELKIAAEGEICARGPSVMAGYWRQPEATAAAIDRDGWFHTGDVGEFDADGYLRITDRIKDLIVTAGGKKIAPQPIENRVALSPYVAQAVMVGDRRPFPSLLVMPDLERLAAWAGEHGLPTMTPEALCRTQEILELMERETLGQLQDLAHFERPKKIAIISEVLTIESGLLTPTMKIRRRIIEQRYHAVIESLYAAGTRGDT